MQLIPKKYIMDENSNKIAVQIDIDTYQQIEKILEDYALGKFIQENKDEKLFSLEEAKVEYAKMKKAV